MNKKISWKKQYGKCAICEESNYSLLDVHRIVPGEEGGVYVKSNILVLCANCHRGVHSKIIDLEIIRKGYSTRGEVLIYKESGENKVKFIS